MLATLLRIFRRKDANITESGGAVGYIFIQSNLGVLSAKQLFDNHYRLKPLEF